MNTTLKDRTRSAIASAIAALTLATVNPARALITVDATSTATVSSAGSPKTLWTAYDASASAKLVVTVSGENGNSGVCNVTGMTYRGVAMIKAVEKDGVKGSNSDIGAAAIYYLDNPGAAGDIIVTFNNSQNNMCASLLRLSGTAAGVGPFNSAQAYVVCPTTTTVSLTTAKANSLVVAHFYNQGNGNVSTTLASANSPLTQVCGLKSPSSYFHIASGYQQVPTAGTVTSTFGTGSVSTPANLCNLITVAAAFEPFTGVTPTITATPATLQGPLSTTYGTASAARSVSVTGTNLSGNITVSAPTGFRVSSDNVTFGSTATFTNSGGSASGTLYMRLAATATVAGNYNSMTAAILSSTGATSANVATTATGNAVSKVTPTVTVTVGSYTYNGSPQGPTTYTTYPSGETGAATWSYQGTGTTSYGPSTTRPTAGGTYTATVSLAADSNFNAAASSPTAFVVHGQATRTFQLGASPASTRILEGTTGLLPWITKGTLPAGSILRSVSVNAKLEADDGGDSYGNDICAYLDPSPQTPGTAALLQFGGIYGIGTVTQVIGWANGGAGVGTSVIDTKTGTDWPARGNIDLNTVQLSVGNDFYRAFWSGTLSVTYDDDTPPTLTSIADNKSGGPIATGTLVSYTVTFSEAIDASTVTAANFGNAGTAAIAIGSVTETTPTSGIFLVQVTPTSPGTLILKVNTGAVVKDLAGNVLNTTSAIVDDTTIAAHRRVTRTYRLGTSPASTTIAPGTAGLLPWIAKGSVPAGSILRSVSVNAKLESVTDPLVTDQWASDLNIYLDPSPQTPGTAARLQVGGSGAMDTVNLALTDADSTGWVNGQDVVGTSVIDTKTEAAWASLGAIDLSSVQLSVGNDYSEAAWSGTLTLVYDDDTAPALASIVDDKTGGVVAPGTLVTYTVAFNKDMDASTVSAADFGNAGTASVTIGAVTQTAHTPGIFNVQATPTSLGTLILKVNADADLKDLAGDAVVTTSAIPDDTTLAVHRLTTRTYQLGTSPASTTIAPGADALLPWIVKGTLPAGSILRWVSVNAKLENVTDPTVLDQVASDLNVYIDPTPLDPGTAAILQIGGSGAMGYNDPLLALTDTNQTGWANGQVAWVSGQAGPTVIDAKNDAAWSSAGAIDLHDVQVSVGNAYSEAAWSGTLTVSYEDTTIPVSGYDAWKIVNAPTGTAADDYDGDGVSNGVEYVLGGTKDTNDSGKLPKLSTVGGNRVYTFTRDQKSIDGSTTVEIEVGTNLATWPTIYTVPDTAQSHNPGVTVVKGTSGFDTVTLTLPQSPDATEFARLKVAVAP